MKKTIKTLTVIGLAAALVAGLSSCDKEKKSDVKKIQVAHTNYYKPYDFVNEAGESDGFEVAVLKEVDKLLPQYEFVYNPTSDDDLLIGVLQGKYDVGTKGVWKTAEREKKYVFPKNPIGASVIGIVVRTEITDKVNDLPSFAKYSGKLVPIGAQNAMFNVIDEYNKANPDAQVNLIAGDSFEAQAGDAYVWVTEGRYDAFVDIKLSYQNNVEKDGAPYGSYKGKLT